MTKNTEEKSATQLTKILEKKREQINHGPPLVWSPGVNGLAPNRVTLNDD
jgi:hypothetical protein